MRRLEAFLYSRKNIAGSLLALGGLGLYFLGIVTGPLWLPVTAGMYAIGYLLVPGEQGLAIRLNAAQDAAEVREGLDKLLRGIKGRVADDLYAKVVRIQASILGTLEAEGATNNADPNVYLIRQTALSYLPDAFAAYLRMPRRVAERRAIANGRTPHDVLLDQLDLMDRRLEDVADDIVQHDSDKLLANGRFIAEKFGVSPFDLDAAADVAAETAANSPAGVSEQTSEPASDKATEAASERERVH